MLAYKDSTISSKTSEYDNVPILPSDYHNLNHTSNYHSYQDNVETPPPPVHQEYHTPHEYPHQEYQQQHQVVEYQQPEVVGYRPESASNPPPHPPPVPQHQIVFTPPTTPTTTATGFINHNYHHPGGASPEAREQARESPPPIQRPLHFPTETNHLGYDPLEGQPSQQQESHESLDQRFVPFKAQKQQSKQRQQQTIQQQQQRDGTASRQPGTAMRQQGAATKQQGGTGRSATATTTTASRTKRQQKKRSSHRESYGEMSTAASMVFYCLVFLAEILMFGLLSLVLFWVVHYRGGFAWTEDPAREFNYHPVLMVTGFFFLMGHAMLVNRLFRCCNKVTTKILHTFLNLLAVPCIVVGMITVFHSHDLRSPPIPNLYSLHSWLGLVTIGLFGLQLVVGFFSFWLLLCCEQATAKFRAGLVPVHATFGIITFMLAIATAVTGYTEKAFFSLKNDYKEFVDETYVINAQAACLAGLAILMGFLLYSSRYARTGTQAVAIVDAPSSSHYVMTQKTYYYRDHE